MKMKFISGVLGEISLIKNERIALEHYFSKNCAEDIFRKIFASYEQRKRNARLIDFDDMLSYTWELLTKRRTFWKRGRRNSGTFW